MACRGETDEGCVDPCLDDPIETPGRAPRQAEKLRDGSRPEPASDFVQGDVVARFRAGHVQLGRSLGIKDILLAQFRQKRDGHLHLTVRKGIHERLKAAAIAGHASIITLSVAGHFLAEGQALRPEHRSIRTILLESGSAVGWDVTSVSRD